MQAPSVKSTPAISLRELAARQGELIGISEWVTIHQSMVDDFAQVSGDFAFIHTDPARAATTRFGGTIAHGLLILSLLPSLMRSATPPIARKVMGANYGYDRVRFITPVPVGRRIRSKFKMNGISERSADFHILHYGVEVELEDSVKPALSAEWQLGVWISTDS